MNCIFCKIINNEIPCYKLYEDEQVIVFLDINPITNGHALVVPKSHVTDIYEADDKLIAHMYNVAKDIANNLMKKLNKNGCSFHINYGSCQDIKHLHLHILPGGHTTVSDMNVEEVYKLVK